VKSHRLAFLFAPVVMIALGGIFPVPSPGQDSNSAAEAGKELAGKKIFYQRCSVCHLPPLRGRTAGVKSYAPSLKGVVSDETEQHARETIQKGSRDVMPGFQYGLRPDQIDDIVAFLETYR
jgi:mono/diheme cytochrome c family protein